jgi:hypothetical protein
MSCEFIEKPPENINDYFVLKYQDNHDDFVSKLITALQENTLNFTTGDIPIGWAMDAINFVKPKNYRIRIQRTPVNFGEIGTAYGIFYFERKPSNPSN